MTKLKIGLLASLAGLLVITAVVALMLAIIHVSDNLPLALIHALIAVFAAIGGRVLFWVTEYKN